MCVQLEDIESLNWMKRLTTDQQSARLSQIWIEKEIVKKISFEVFFGSFPSCSPLATERDIHPALKLEEISPSNWIMKIHP